MTGTTEPLVLALLALVAVTTALQILVRRANGKNGSRAGFTEEEAGQIKEKVAKLEQEAEKGRNWRHDDYVRDQTRLYQALMPRHEVDYLRKASEADRTRLWVAVDELKSELRRRQ